MKNFINTIQAISTILGGYLGWILGESDGFLYALLIFVLIDYLSGLMLAVYKKKLSSEVGYIGIFRKVLIFALVGIGNIVDVNIIQSGNTIRTAVIFFYLSNEGISILENVSKLGLPVPEKLKNVLEQINNKKERGTK